MRFGQAGGMAQRFPWKRPGFSWQGRRQARHLGIGRVVGQIARADASLVGPMADNPVRLGREWTVKRIALTCLMTVIGAAYLLNAAMATGMLVFGYPLGQEPLPSQWRPGRITTSGSPGGRALER